MRFRLVISFTFAAVLATTSPALANKTEPGPVLSHAALDETENHLGYLGLIGLLGLFGLRRRDDRH